MAGRIRTKERCPKCGGKFSGNPLACPACLTNPKRYFIDLYTKNFGRLKIYSDRGGHPLDSWGRANRVIETIRYEIDQHAFDPAKYVKSDLKNFCFETQIELWYQEKEKEVEKGNLSPRYSHELRRYINVFYLPFFKGRDIRDIRTFIIREFYNQLPAHLSLKYTKNILDALGNFFNTIWSYDLIEKKPSFPIITLDRKTPRWIDRKTQGEILGIIPEGDQSIFAFLIFQGIRPGEARALKVRDIDLHNETILISRTFSGPTNILRERTKSKVVRPRAINPVLTPILRKAIRDKHPEAFVFINPRTGTYYTESALRCVWNKARKTIGLDINLYQATRHSFATNALKDGSDLKSIGDILGHTDIRTTLLYAHTDIDNQRAVFRKQQGIIIDFVPRLSPSVENDM